jgi:uncharacterized protein YraI
MHETFRGQRVIRVTLTAIAIATMAAHATAALAFTATVVTPVHMRAGPAIEYPAVALLPPGVDVQVFGCEQGYGWCDVQAGPNRGWIAAGYLQMPATGGTVVIASNGVTLGIPIITFSFNTYWSTWYRGRPWYAQRAHYYNYWHRYPHGRPPPPPRPRPPARPPPATRPPAGRPSHGSGKPPPGAGKPPEGKPPPGKPPADRPRGDKPPGDKSPPGNDRSSDTGAARPPDKGTGT